MLGTGHRLFQIPFILYKQGYTIIRFSRQRFICQTFELLCNAFSNNLAICVLLFCSIFLKSYDSTPPPLILTLDLACYPLTELLVFPAKKIISSDCSQQLKFLSDAHIWVLKRSSKQERLLQSNGV